MEQPSPDGCFFGCLKSLKTFDPSARLWHFYVCRNDIKRKFNISGVNVISDVRNIRVLIAEDEALVRQGIVALIEAEVDEIVEVSDGEQALQLLKSEPFDLALIDIGLPLRTGLDVMTEIRHREIPLKIIILTGDTQMYSPRDIYQAGADAFVYKTVDAESFLEIFIAVLEGKDLPDFETSEGENANSIAEIRDSLTTRELQIVKLVVEGSSNKKTAENLFISEHTVRKHREHINRKLEAKSPAALAAFAIKAGLV